MQGTISVIIYKNTKRRELNQMANKDYKDLARDIVDHVGGEGNVNNLRHCITRLRFNLKDDNKADTDYLKKMDGVVTVIQSGGQYQVVIGEQVAEVYEAIMSETGLGSGGSNESDYNENDERNLLEKFIDFISGVFQPFLMALAATGMIKGVVALLGTLGVDSSSGLYQVLNFAGDGFFQFLPIMVAITAARKMRANEFTSLAIAVAFLHPSLMSLTESDVLYTLFSGTAFASPIHSTFLGIPLILPQGGYYSAIIPVIVAVWFGSKVEKWIKNVIPRVVRSFLTPFFTILIAVPVSLIVIGPITSWGADLIGVVFTTLLNFSPLVFGALLAASWQILVIFGLHWGIIPIMFLLLAEQGVNPFGPVMMVSTFGVLGVVLALIIKSKNKKIRDIGIPGSISLLFGISEPVIYGLMLPLKRSFVYALIANTIGGAYIGVTGTTAYRTGGLGIFSIFNTIDPDGAITMNFWNIIIGFAIATAIGFIIQMILPVPTMAGAEAEGKEATLGNKEVTKNGAATTEEMKESAKEEIIGSPVTGQVMTLSETPDEVFSSGALGKGIAVKPTKGIVVSPANGTVSALFETGHAIGITTEAGTELLIHIGIDTVELEGRGFNALVEKGQSVKAGQELIQFDINVINEAGYSPIIPIIVTNTADYADVLLTNEQSIDTGDYLMTTLK